MAQHRLILEFLNESPDFAYGFEAGKLYQQMKSGQRSIEGIYHRVNTDQICLMARTLGYSVTSLKLLDEHWISVIMRRRSFVSRLLALFSGEGHE